MLIDIFNYHLITQIQQELTRMSNILYLYCTNKSVLVRAMSTLPGVSDHKIILAHIDVKPSYSKKMSQFTNIFSRAKLKEESLQFSDTLLE